MAVTIRPQGPITFRVIGTNLAVIRSIEQTSVVRIVQSASPIPVTGGSGARVTWTPPSALQTWLIPHNLGFKPQVTILDQQGNIVYGDIQHLDPNTLSIAFTVPMYGTAQLG